MHILALDIQDSVFNSKYLYLNDLSRYDPELLVAQQRICIAVPGYDTYTVLWPNGQRTVALDSILLGITTDTLSDLPDGVYEIEYSVSPNNEVYLRKKFMRTSALYLKWLNENLKTDVEIERNAIDDRGNLEIDKRVKVLTHTLTLITGAKASAEIYNDTVNAEKMYKQACYEIDKINEDYLRKPFKDGMLW
jgi:hypothetical protein